MDTHSRLSFRAVLRLEGKTATGIQVPSRIVQALGQGQKPPVRVTIGGHTYRSHVAAYNGVYMLPVSAENREKAGVSAGDEVEVFIELDNEPRMVEAPDDFQQALDADPAARHNWEKLSYSHKRRHVLAIDEAKSPGTRARRIEKAIIMLREGGK